MGNSPYKNIRVCITENNAVVLEEHILTVKSNATSYEIGQELYTKIIQKHLQSQITKNDVGISFVVQGIKTTNFNLLNKTNLIQVNLNSQAKFA